jgi:hypothetical protein
MFPNLLYTSSQVSTISKLVLTTPLRFTSNYEDQEPFSHAKSFFKELKTRWWSIYIYIYIYIHVYFLVIYLFEAELANLDKKVVDWHGELWLGVFGSGSRAKGWEAFVTRYGARNVGVLTKLPFVTIMDACIGTHCGHGWSWEGAKKFQLPMTSIAIYFFSGL